MIQLKGSQFRKDIEDSLNKEYKDAYIYDVSPYTKDISLRLANGDKREIGIYNTWRLFSNDKLICSSVDYSEREFKEALFKNSINSIRINKSSHDLIIRFNNNVELHLLVMYACNNNWSFYFSASCGWHGELE